MYAFLRGQLVDPGPPTVVECGGVGYEVWVPQRDTLRLPPAGTVVHLHTHLQVREDDQTLYGFLRGEDREVFRSLLGVNGVGPKVALALLGEESADRILAAIGQGDAGPLVKVKGIGRKTAERLVMELKDLARTWGTAQPHPVTAPGSDDDEATLALVAMGVPPERARAAVARIDEADRRRLGVEDLVRRALRHAAS